MNLEKWQWVLMNRKIGSCPHSYIVGNTHGICVAGNVRQWWDYDFFSKNKRTNRVTGTTFHLNTRAKFRS